MKKIFSFAAFTLLLSVFFTSCLEDECNVTHRYTRYEPVLLSIEEVRAQIGMKSSQDLVTPGKMYFYDTYLFINEIGKGIHIFDNINIENPVNLGFLNIPGNYDLAIKDEILYADNSNDLLSFNIDDIQNPVLLNIVENVYANPHGNQNEVLLYYNQVENEIVDECEDHGWWYKSNGDILLFDSFNSNSVLGNGFEGNASNTGIGGSFARFTIAQNHLYTVDENSLSSFDLSDKQNPVLSSTIDVGWGIETIFPYQDNLFIGSESGLFIYGIDNPTMPTYQSEFQHARACDPVYVEGDIAYVTLRDGSECTGFVNQLDIIDIKDINNPTLIATHDMINPHGLTVRNSQILLCEGDSGLKIIDATDSHDIDVKKHLKDFHAYDIISLSERHFMLIGNDGFYQYEFNEDQDPELLSHIAVAK